MNILLGEVHISLEHVFRSSFQVVSFEEIHSLHSSWLLWSNLRDFLGFPLFLKEQVSYSYFLLDFFLLFLLFLHSPWGRRFPVHLILHSVLHPLQAVSSSGQINVEILNRCFLSVKIVTSSKLWRAVELSLLLIPLWSLPVPPRWNPS